MEKELRVYLIKVNETDKYVPTLTDSEFMDIAEEQGNVMTVETFTGYFNGDLINSNTDAIRFIEVNADTADKVIAWYESIDMSLLKEQMNSLIEISHHDVDTCEGLYNMLATLTDIEQ